MLTSFTIKNFRCFSELTLAPLARVNLIAGKNDVGKTALLEALFLKVGWFYPGAPVNVGGLRGLARMDLPFVPYWLSWLFSNKEFGEGIHLESEQIVGGATVREELILKLVHPTAAEVPASAAPGTEATGIPVSTSNGKEWELRIEHSGPEGEHSSRVFRTPDGLRMEGIPPVRGISGSYIPSSRHLEGEDTRRFGQIDAQKRQEELLGYAKVVEPRLVRLSLILQMGAPMLYGDVGLKELVPIAYVGDGLRNLLSMLLAVMCAEGGIVLIDEIENGLHHSVLEGVWSALATAARKADVQIFATTHSMECIQAAHEAFTKSGTYDFRLHRLERAQDQVRAVTFDQEGLASAIQFNWEIR